MKKILIVAGAVSALAASGLAAAGLSTASERQSEATAATNRAEIEAIVHDYLLANPEILIEMQTALEQKMREQQAAASRQAIAESADLIFNSEYDGVIGNPDGDVTVVEFFDYNCGYCRRALSDMEALVQSDPNLRFVLKEFPILGPESHEAHVVSMAFRELMPEKYGEFHRKLLGGGGRADGESAMKIALELGADEAQLRERMRDPEIEAAFRKTYELADRLQITGTPSYVIGQELVFGALGKDHLSEKIESARQ